MSADVPLTWPVGTLAWMYVGGGAYRRVRINDAGQWEEVLPLETHYNQEES